MALEQDFFSLYWRNFTERRGASFAPVLTELYQDIDTIVEFKCPVCQKEFNSFKELKTHCYDLGVGCPQYQKHLIQAHKSFKNKDLNPNKTTLILQSDGSGSFVNSTEKKEDKDQIEKFQDSGDKLVQIMKLFLEDVKERIEIIEKISDPLCSIRCPWCQKKFKPGKLIIHCFNPFKGKSNGRGCPKANEIGIELMNQKSLASIGKNSDKMMDMLVNEKDPLYKLNKKDILKDREEADKMRFCDRQTSKFMYSVDICAKYIITLKKKKLLK